MSLRPYRADECACRDDDHSTDVLRLGVSGSPEKEGERKAYEREHPNQS